MAQPGAQAQAGVIGAEQALGIVEAAREREGGGAVGDAAGEHRHGQSDRRVTGDDVAGQEGDPDARDERRHVAEIEVAPRGMGADSVVSSVPRSRSPAVMSMAGWKAPTSTITTMIKGRTFDSR